jgi:predicted component of type VI protein secretion system
MSYSPWLTGPNGQQWKLDGEKYLLGRDAPADIVFDSPRISRQHALITRVDADGSTSRLYLGDLSSRNGTFVNGQPVANEAVRLKDGDEIVLGGVIALRFHDPGETVEGPRLGKLRGVWVDEATRAVWVDAQPVEPPLSAAQFTLMKLLYDNAGNVVSRAQLISTVWPDSDPAGVSEEAVDGLIKRLRARLRETQPERDYLEVLRGQGLRLVSGLE